MAVGNGDHRRNPCIYRPVSPDVLLRLPAGRRCPVRPALPGRGRTECPAHSDGRPAALPDRTGDWPDEDAPLLANVVARVGIAAAGDVWVHGAVGPDRPAGRVHAAGLLRAG